MKNFSTIATRFAAAALLACVVAGPVQAAAKCAFKPNAPDQHLVVKGDTLWDISGKFLEHAWCWPQVWGINKDQIKNPHWIYPGQIVYFDRKNGRLSLNKPGSGNGGDGITRLSPQIRTEATGRDHRGNGRSLARAVVLIDDHAGHADIATHLAEIFDRRADIVGHIERLQVV